MNTTLTAKQIKNIAVLPFQRQASVRQPLVNSMKIHGFLGTILMIKSSLISGIEKLYIIDGQHRFLAARLLDLPIPASIIEVNTTKEYLVELISTLNSTGKKWAIEDYINAYASLENESYVKLLQLMSKCKKLSSNNVVNLITLKSPRSVKNGSFKLSDDSANNLLTLNNLLYKIPKQSVQDLYILNKIINNKKFNEDIFVKNYLANLNTLTPLLHSEKERIYNSWF